MSNIFKSFTPYLNNSGRSFRSSDFNAFDEHEVEDPSPTSWGSVGYAQVVNEELCIDVQGAGFLAMVQFNERILPGSVQKEKIAERLADIEHRDGRKPGKKEYAQVRDEVILELLPEAFIKRKLIPVLFVKDRLFIFTTSAKKCDDTLLLLQRSMPGDSLAPGNLMNAVPNNITGTLTTITKEGTTRVDNEDYDINPFFQTSNAAVLKGENKQTIRIKDKEIGSHDVQTLMKQDYEITAVALDYFEPAMTDPDATIVLTDKLTVSKFVVNGVAGERSKDEKDEQDTFINTAWMAARLVNSVTSLIIEVMGGLKGMEEKVKSTTPAYAEDIDDL